MHKFFHKGSADSTTLVLLELSVVATGDAKLVGDQEVPVPG